MSLLNKRLQSGFLVKLGRVRLKNASAMPLLCTKQSFFVCGKEIVGSSKNCDIPKGFKAILLSRKGCFTPVPMWRITRFQGNWCGGIWAEEKLSLSRVTMNLTKM